MIDKKINVILELERLKKYHPIFEIAYMNCTYQNLPCYLEQQISLGADITNKNKFEEYYKTLTEVYALGDQDIANMFGIIQVYYEHCNPIVAEEVHSLQKRLLKIVDRIDKLTQATSKSSVKFLVKSNKQFSKTNGFEISEPEELEKVFYFLKVSYVDRLHTLKSSFQAIAGENRIEEAELYLDKAVSLANGKIGDSANIKAVQELKKELKKFIPKNNHNKIRYKNDLLRMIYKTLLDYLNRETSIIPEGAIDGVQKQTSVIQYRIIYQLCYGFGLINRIDDLTKQYEKVKNILKDFKVDKRPKLKWEKVGMRSSF